MFRKIDDIKMESAPNYKIDGRQLKLMLSGNNVKEIKFEYPIRQVVHFKSRLLIRIEPDMGKLFNENVYCYSNEGELLWQVQQINTIDTDCPYTNITEIDGNLFFYNWSGEKVQIDVQNGKVLKKEFNR